MSYRSLDLRDIADDWRDALDDGDEDAVGKYKQLCAELDLLEAHPDGLKQYGNSHEPTLIRVEDFEELAVEISGIPDDLRWPLYCIDWEHAARELAHDYSLVRYDGDEYYIRSV